LREEDKEEGEDLERGSFVLGKIGEEGGGRNFEGDREEGGNWKNNCFGNSHRALLLLGTLGSGARKPQGFLELGSRRGCS
jgi:hypothetical protein